MIVIKTFENSDKSAKCLICNTNYENGTPINPIPSCNCKNLHFDITPNAVRILINHCFIKHPTGQNWQEDVLHEIEIHGAPKNVVEFSDLSKDEKKQFPSFKVSEDFDLMTIE